MSFARWGSDSDVYIFNTEFDCITCFGCLLQYQENESDNFTTRSLKNIQGHLHDHRDAGHKVPDGLEKDIEVNWLYDA